MKKKWNLTLSIVAMALTLALFSFGVYAAVSPSFTISNNITFSPTNVAVDIVGSVSGYDSSETDGLQNYTHTADISKPIESPANWEDSLLTGLTFQNKETPIVFTFTITSRSAMKFAVYITGYSTDSEKIVNTPSHNVDNKLVFEVTDRDSSKELTFKVQVRNTCNFSFTGEANNFNVVIEPIFS